MKKVYIASGYTTTFFGPGRKEFNPKKPFPPFEGYLKEVGEGVCKQLGEPAFDEGLIGSFMSARFLHQANLPGFLPYMVPELAGKPGTAIEGACGTGGRCLVTAIQSILSGCSDAIFVCAFEMQNVVKSVYGADILAGAGYYNGQRKKGHAFYFPGVFDQRAAAYMEKYGEEKTRKGMACWYEKAITNARLYPKAQEYHNTAEDLYERGMAPPNAKRFLPHLNPYHCSKVTDGAVGIGVYSEEGLRKCGIPKEKAVEVVSWGGAVRDITLPPKDLTFLEATHQAVGHALTKGKLKHRDIGLLEVHDCFAIGAILSLESAGFADRGKGAAFIQEGSLPTNVTGGLIGFGHPTGASGIRMMVDLLDQLTGEKKYSSPYGMMISMGGDDITVSSLIVKA